MHHPNSTRAEESAMASIRATCSHCSAQVPLEPTAVVLKADLPAADVDGVRTGAADLGTYSFLCTRCGQIATRTASTAAVRLLLLVGVWVDAGLLADGEAEPETRVAVLHPESPPPGPVLTSDDLLDLHRVMAEEDWFLRLAEVPRPAR